MTAVQEISATTPSIAVVVRESLESFSASERKVARILLANYPIAGLETVAELAKRSNVSAPTVIRFVTRLGFAGYPSFQKALMHEVQANLGSPLAQYNRKDLSHEDEHVLAFAASTFTSGINETLSELPKTEFDAAVALLCSTRRRIHLVGGKFSGILASYLAAHLQLLRGETSEVPQDEVARLGLVADASRSDILVVFDYRRYDPDVVRFAQRMADRGCDVLLLTDSGMSPAADAAAIVLPARVEAPSPFDSLVPAMSIVESLIASVSEKLGEGGRRRIEDIEQMRTHRSGRRQSPGSET